MDKTINVMLKGVAILMMLYLHLFNTLSVVQENCINYIYIGGLPLSYIFARCAHPVSMYLLLSGCGFYKQYEIKRNNRNIGSKIIRLYIHYWIALFIFVSIGSFVRPDIYPGNYINVIENVTGWHTTYNYTMWFLFPYIILIVCSGLIFRVVDKFPISITVISIILYVLTYGIFWKYGEFLQKNMWLYNPLLATHFLCPFISGVLFVKYDVINKVKVAFKDRRLLLVGFIGALIAFRCCTDLDAIHIIYTIILVLLLSAVRFPRWIGCVLEKLGKHSTSMWFVHAYFYTYLFHDFIYGFKYPLLIFIILVLVSY